MPFKKVSRSLAFAAVKKAQAFQADQLPPMETPKKRGRQELITLRLKELLDKAETELAKYDIAPVRWVNRKLVCNVFVFMIHDFFLCFFFLIFLTFYTSIWIEKYHFELFLSKEGRPQKIDCKSFIYKLISISNHSQRDNFFSFFPSMK